MRVKRGIPGPVVTFTHNVHGARTVVVTRDGVTLWDGTSPDPSPEVIRALANAREVLLANPMRDTGPGGDMVIQQWWSA